MVRLSLLFVALTASLMFAGNFWGFVPTSPPRCSHCSVSKPQCTWSEGPVPGAQAAMTSMAVLAGLLIGIFSPQAALAGTGGARPDFQVVRPGYMQGIDAANAASKPGEIDYVTRSRLEAAQFPKAIKELELERTTLSKAPTKEERLQKVQQQVQEYSQSLDNSKVAIDG